MNSFFYLSSTGSNRKLAEWVHDAVDLETVHCSLDPAHQRAGRRLSELTVVLPEDEGCEFVWTWQNDLLVREDVISSLSSAGFTGYVLKPVHIEARGTEQAYFEISITGWGGLAPHSSGVREITRCEACGYVTYNCWTDPEQLIDAEHWDGSDFFVVWPIPAFKFITARVAELIKSKGWKGTRINRLGELHCKGTLSPGRLRDHMPMARAEQLALANRELVL